MKKSQDFVLLGIDDITGADIRLLRQIGLVYFLPHALNAFSAGVDH